MLPPRLIAIAGAFFAFMAGTIDAKHSLQWMSLGLAFLVLAELILR